MKKTEIVKLGTGVYSVRRFGKEIGKATKVDNTQWVAKLWNDDRVYINSDDRAKAVRTVLVAFEESGQ